MENQLGSTTIIEKIFSSKKRIFGFLLIVTLALTLPLTMNLLGQRQDLRQRAQIATVSPTPQPTPENSSYDLNSDGTIDELDLNILYYGFTNREGD